MKSVAKKMSFLYLSVRYDFASTHLPTSSSSLPIPTLVVVAAHDRSIDAVDRAVQVVFRARRQIIEVYSSCPNPASTRRDNVAVRRQPHDLLQRVQKHRGNERLARVVVFVAIGAIPPQRRLPVVHVDVRVLVLREGEHAVVRGQQEVDVATDQRIRHGSKTNTDGEKQQEELFKVVLSFLQNDALLELIERVALGSVVHADLVMRQAAHQVVHDQEGGIRKMKTILGMLLGLIPDHEAYDRLNAHLLCVLLGNRGRGKVHATRKWMSLRSLVRQNVVLHVLVHVGHLGLHVVHDALQIGVASVPQLKHRQRRSQLVLLQNVSGDGLRIERGEEFHAIHVVDPLLLCVNGTKGRAHRTPP